ncbi:MAG: hypothetical protein LIO90_10200 [Bacteroidales bacterium]|nr:hypothetical protein [Bacteroidales bacterium]
MKNPGDTAYFVEERSRQLWLAMRRYMATAPLINIHDALCHVVNQPAPRFWVSEERASAVVSSIIRGGSLEGMHPLKREMFEEIHRRVILLRQQRPESCLFELVKEVVWQPAPKYYLSPLTARRLYYHYRMTLEKRPIHLRWNASSSTAHSSSTR